MTNQPYSEQWRLKALEAVDADDAARMLEESKTAVLSERIKGLGDMPYAHAERDVKASQWWRAWVKSMVNARTTANRLKIEAEFLKMKYFEGQSMNADKRTEMRMTT